MNQLTANPHGGQRLPRRSKLTVVLAALVTLLMVATTMSPAAAHGKKRDTAIVVANRGSGDISVIDSATLAVNTVDLPGDAEPMYVSHDRRTDRVFVGDRAASTVVVLDDETYEVIDSVDVGEGVFHQWLDARRKQLWVVGDTSQTVTVVDTRDLDVLATIDIPQDLVDRGGKPHDVFVWGRFAFVSILGLDDGMGAVLQYSTHTFEEQARISVGDDPHLFVQSGLLYVASQESSTVAVFRARNLHPINQITVPAAHGIYVTNRGEVLATNIAGGGTDAVWEVKKRGQAVVDTVDTDVPTPHNLTVDNRRQVFVTHSGPTANQVSVIDLERRGFGDVTTVTVGTNPFGIAYVR